MNAWNKLPRTRKRAKMGCNGNDCACCEETLLNPLWFVVTDQGEFPVGPTCAIKCRKAGFEVVSA